MLRGRTAAFVWATKEAEPLAVMSWDRNAKSGQAASTYKIHVLRWAFKTDEQSPTRAAAYQADIAPWAVAPSTTPVCEGATPGALAPAERFRITSLSIVSDKSREGVEFETPRIEAVVAGVYGAVAFRERPKDGPNARAPRAVMADAERPSTGSEQSRQLAISAVCNAGGLRDFQLGNDRRIWAVRRDDLGVVRLLGPGQDGCEGPSLAVASESSGSWRAYAPPRGDRSNLQVLDLGADNEVERLTIAEPPGTAAGKEGSLPPIVAPAVCSLSKSVAPGSCDQGALAEVLGEGEVVKVGVLLRDISTDAGSGIETCAIRRIGKRWSGSRT